MHFRIGQLNVRGSIPVWTNLERIAEELGLEVVLIQDPPPVHCMDSHPWGSFTRILPGDPSPKAMIMVKTTLGFRPCGFEGARVCGATVIFRGDPLVLVSAYIRHTTGEGADALATAVRRAHELSPFIYVGMDGNGHSPLWGPVGTRLDRVEEAVEGVLCEGGLWVVNSQESAPTYRSDAGCESWIDVTAASAPVIPLIAEWAVRDSVEVLSDHRLIVGQLLRRPVRQTCRTVRDWEQVDWRAFQRQLVRELDPRWASEDWVSPGDLDRAVGEVTASIKRVIEQLVPTKRLCRFSRWWWTPELTQLRHRVATARRRWMRTGRIRERETFLYIRHRFCSALSVAKAAAWRRLCERATSSDFWSLYGRLRRGGGAKGVDDLVVGDRVVRVDLEKAKVLSSVFFPQLAEMVSPRQDTIDRSWSTARPPGIFEGGGVTAAEVICAVRRARTMAAPGLDGIPVRVLQRCIHTLLPWLMRIFSGSLRSGHYPLVWRTACVIALRKPGKSSYDTPRSYRPISLLPSMGKILESIVARRLVRSLESRGCLSTAQCGFCAGRDVVGACRQLADAVTSAFRRREQVQAVALDLQAAYDTVWQAGLWLKLRRKGVQEQLLWWIRGFLVDRLSQMVVGEATLEVHPSCGVPQGSPLSCPLFLVFIDDLLWALLNAAWTSQQAFADDLILWRAGSLRSGVIHPGLRKALRLAERWAVFWRLRFSVPKCESICFRASNVVIEREFVARMYGDTISHVSVIRYLGVWFDRSLTWGHQVTVATTRVRERLWMVRRLGGRGWGLHPHLFLRMVQGAVFPLLFFGAPCWASILRYSSRLSQVDAILAMAARMAYRLERTTSVEASLALAGILPARQQILRRLLRYLWRRDRAALMATDGPIPERHLLASELGRAFFQRSVRGCTISTSIPPRRAIVLGGIDRALHAEWQRRWRSSTQGAALREVLPRVGTPWRQEEATVRSGSTWDFTLVARFFTGHCHLGSFQPPWHEHEDLASCPFCDEVFTRAHLVWECRGVTDVRHACLGELLPDSDDFVGWAHLLGSRAAGLVRFLRSVGLMIDRED